MTTPFDGQGSPFGNTELSIIRVNSSAAPGTDQMLQREIHVFRLVGVNGQQINVLLPSIKLSPFGGWFNFIEWNGLGTVVFEKNDSDSEDINGASSLTLLEADYGARTLFLLVAFGKEYHLVKMGADNSLLPVSGSVPNVQVSAAGKVDAGKSKGDLTLYLARNEGDAGPSLANGATLLGRGLGALSANATVVGTSSGTVGAGGVVVGQASNTVGTGSAVVGTAANTVGPGSVVLGTASSTVGNNSLVVGTALNAVGGDAVVLGNVDGSVPDDAIVLGHGTASNVVGRLNILGGEGVVDDTSTAATKGLNVNIDGTVYRFLMVVP